MTNPIQAAGPATVTAVAGKMDLPEQHPEYRHVREVVAAVNDFVSDFHSPDADTGQFRPKVVQGANMLAARLVRRRNSPGGVEPYATPDAEYVQRYDPDVAQMLELGQWRRLVAG